MACDNFEPEWFHDEEYSPPPITDNTDDNEIETMIPEDRYCVVISIRNIALRIINWVIPNVFVFQK